MHTFRLQGSAADAPLALAALVLLAAWAGAHAWTDCSTGPAIFKVSDVTLEPSPVKPGDTAQFSIIAESGADVQAGSVQMVVHYVGMPIWTQIDDLCAKADCPIKKGPTEVRYIQPFPAITPPGSYSVTLIGRSGDDALFCVTVDFQVVPPEAADLALSWQAALKGSSSQEAAQQVVSASQHRKSLVR